MKKSSVNTAEAILLFDTGSLTSSFAAPSVVSSGWILHFKAKGCIYVLSAQRDDLRVFKSADAVISTANKIGFKEVTFNY